MLPVAVARYSSDGIVMRYLLPVLRMTSCFHTMDPIGGRTSGTVLCSSQASVDVSAGQAWAALATGSLARRAGLQGRRPGRALAVCGWTQLLLGTVVRVSLHTISALYTRVKSAIYCLVLIRHKLNKCVEKLDMPTPFT